MNGNQNHPVGAGNNRRDVMENPNEARIGSLTFDKVWDWVGDKEGFQRSKDGTGEVFTIKPRPRQDKPQRNQMIASGDSGGPILRISSHEGRYELIGVICGALAANNQLDLDVWGPDTSIKSGNGHIVSLLPNSCDRNWLDALVQYLEVPTLIEPQEVIMDTSILEEQEKKKKKREREIGSETLESGKAKVSKVKGNDEGV